MPVARQSCATGESRVNRECDTVKVASRFVVLAQIEVFAQVKEFFVSGQDRHEFTVDYSNKPIDYITTQFAHCNCYRHSKCNCLGSESGFINSQRTASGLKS